MPWLESRTRERNVSFHCFAKTFNIHLRLGSLNVLEAHSSYLMLKIFINLKFFNFLRKKNLIFNLINDDDENSFVRPQNNLLPEGVADNFTYLSTSNCRLRAKRLEMIINQLTVHAYVKTYFDSYPAWHRRISCVSTAFFPFIVFRFISFYLLDGDKYRIGIQWKWKSVKKI